MQVLTLRRARLRRAWTQAEAASRVGYDQRAWQRWEKHYSKPGARRPPNEVIAVLERLFEGRVNVNSWSRAVMDECSATRVGDLRVNAGRIPRSTLS